jgi:catechol 2,3-dioxygenase-like lactoylglutathione lyase family enzyme
MEVLSSRVILRVADFARSRAFYEETLGLSIYREYGAGGIVSGVVYFLGGGFLELTEGGRSGQRDGALIWTQVPNVATEEARLVAAGVTVRKPAERMAWGLVELWIEDPDGRELRLVEVPDEHPLRRRVT